MTEKRISKKELRLARYRLCLRIGAALLTAMAETDCSHNIMAKRLNTTPEKIKAKIDRLCCGQSLSLRDISDLFFSTGTELVFQVRKRAEPPDETT